MDEACITVTHAGDGWHVRIGEGARAQDFRCQDEATARHFEWLFRHANHPPRRPPLHGPGHGLEAVEQEGPHEFSRRTARAAPRADSE